MVSHKRQHFPGDWPESRTIDLRGNDLLEMPTFVHILPKLESLVLSDNKITCILEGKPTNEHLYWTNF